MLLPGLRRAIWPLFEACPTKLAELEVEALAAFCASLARCRPGRARIASWLCWGSRDRAARLLRKELAERAGPGADPVSAAPPQPFGHPDFVLARAVQAGVISAEDAGLIAATRLEHGRLDEAARRLGIAYPACHLRRSRVEAKLRDFLKSDRYSDVDFVEYGTETPCSSGRGRPRQGAGGARRPGKRRSAGAQAFQGRTFPADPRTAAGGAGDTVSAIAAARAVRERIGGTAPLHKGLRKGLHEGLHERLRPGLEPSDRREPPAPGPAEGSSASADSRGKRA